MLLASSIAKRFGNIKVFSPYRILCSGNGHRLTPPDHGLYTSSIWDLPLLDTYPVLPPIGSYISRPPSMHTKYGCRSTFLLFSTCNILTQSLSNCIYFSTSLFTLNTILNTSFNLGRSPRRLPGGSGPSPRTHSSHGIT